MELGVSTFCKSILTLGKMRTLDLKTPRLRVGAGIDLK